MVEETPMLPAKTPRRPGDPPPRFHVGDRVFLVGIFEKVPAVVTEDRGCLGVGGRRLFQVRLDPEYGDPIITEMPEDQLVPVPAAAK